MRIISLCLASVVALAMPNLAFAKPITVKQVSTQSFNCEGKIKVDVAYYTLSDDSLSFVKLKVGNKNYTLTHDMVANGARYTDMAKVEWWEHQGEASLNMTIYDEKSKGLNCKPKK